MNDISNILQFKNRWFQMIYTFTRYYYTYMKIDIYVYIYWRFICLYIKNCCKEEVKGAKIGTFPEW